MKLKPNTIQIQFADGSIRGCRNISDALKVLEMPVRTLGRTFGRKEKTKPFELVGVSGTVSRGKQGKAYV